MNWMASGIIISYCFDSLVLSSQMLKYSITPFSMEFQRTLKAALSNSMKTLRSLKKQFRASDSLTFRGGRGRRLIFGGRD